MNYLAYKCFYFLQLAKYFSRYELSQLIAIGLTNLAVLPISSTGPKPCSTASPETLKNSSRSNTVPSELKVYTLVITVPS